jgi:ketosteroid isomerase-like protein
MQDSQAVEAAVKAWCERMSAGDVDGVAAMLADDPEAFAIGTQRIGSGRHAWLESIGEMAQMGVAWSTSDVRCWETTDAGFAAGEITAALPDGMRLPMRMSAFLVRDRDAFRIFNIHFSWAVPDEVALPQLESWREQLGLTANS